MSNISVTELKKPDPFVDDPITDILRQGARKLLRQALEAEIEFFLSQHADLKDESGRQRMVRNGYLPERDIQSGIGPVPQKCLVFGIDMPMHPKGFTLARRYYHPIFAVHEAWRN